MSPKFPAANAAIAAITVLTLSLAAPVLGTSREARHSTRPAPAATRQEARLWQWVRNLFLPDDGKPPVHGNSGCEMDPDGVVHVPPPPKTCV